MCEHFVQFYKNDTFLINEVSDFIGPGLQAGAAGIVIATRPHLERIGQRIQQEDSSPHPSRFPAGAYLALDAEETLARFMVNGWPDQARFNRVMDEIFSHPAASSCHRILAFGEMVALLATAGHHAAALRLEELWNQLARRYGFTLLCAYPMESFAGDSQHAAFRDICDAHSRVWPAEAAAAGEGSNPSGGKDNEWIAPPPGKVIRDGFSMPPDDYQLLYELKRRLLQQKRDVTKSGLLRAGLKQLMALSPEELADVVDALQPIKQGRPTKN